MISYLYHLPYIQECYITTHFYVKCKTSNVQMVNNNPPIFGGGKMNSMISYECPVGFTYFGMECVVFYNLKTFITFPEANNLCSIEKTIYLPKSQYQNIIFRYGMLKKVCTALFIDLYIFKLHIERQSKWID